MTTAESWMAKERGSNRKTIEVSFNKSVQAATLPHNDTLAGFIATCSFFCEMKENQRQQ